MRTLRIALLAVAIALAGCANGTQSAQRDGRLGVVAVEDAWGSIAAQLGGDRVEVTSLLTNPDTDPHDFEPTPHEAREIASAGYVIANGLGYDAWVERLLDANPTAGRATLDVGDLLGLRAGDNPHRWYSPDDVEAVVARITEDYKALRPADAAYFDAQRAAFETTALARYKEVAAQIEERYAGAPIGATESAAEPLAAALGLDLTTPPRFLETVSEGGEPTADDKATVDEQIATRAIGVLVFNAQNATPDVQRLVDAARAAGIGVVTITESLTPEGASFQDWQVLQLEALASALAGGVQG